VHPQAFLITVRVQLLFQMFLEIISLCNKTNKKKHINRKNNKLSLFKIKEFLLFLQITNSQIQINKKNKPQPQFLAAI
jgi:hypothetical protein